MEKPRYKPELLIKLNSQLKEMKNDLVAIERQMCQYENSCIKASVKTGNVLSGWSHLDMQADSLEETYALPLEVLSSTVYYRLPSNQNPTKQFRIERLFSFSSPSTEKISKEMMTEQESTEKDLENDSTANNVHQSKTSKCRTSSSNSRPRKRQKH
ncbi:hypothetical protein D918_06882 [Trichuris suis]|nr:hypothetical protein D918_06882 [Trichuris suis]